MVEERRQQSMLQRRTDRDDHSEDRTLGNIQNARNHGQRTYSLTAVRQPSSNRESSQKGAKTLNEDYTTELAIASKMHAFETKMKRATDQRMAR